MQVSHVKDHVTHAVIGGGESIGFGISDSAEFFNILSSTLYKDQILAVVREVLCNAWDAHIEAKCTDKPVEITLTPTKFVIRDFGSGIHKDDIGPIYGTYGNSTKKNDGKQTGGFGLGCKAPFAYTDHFEVISSHEGVRTIYNMSKSNAQAMGKPSITPIASFPTEESGIQVSINLKTPHDFARFEELIRLIIVNGDMNMVFNGSKLETLNFDTTKSNYLIVDESPLNTNHRIYIRYGNVIYPVEISKEIEYRYNQVMINLNQISRNNKWGGYTNTYYIIFQAPPHSISVTPSRESLSMQEHTVNTLNNIFAGYLSDMTKVFNAECAKRSKETIDIAVKEARVDKLLLNEQKLPFIDDASCFERIDNVSDYAKAFLKSHYPNNFKFRKEDITYRLTMMVKEGLLNRGLVQTYLKNLNDANSQYGFRGCHNKAKDNGWLSERIVAPLMVKIKEEGLDDKRLFAYDSMDNNAPNRYSSSKIPLIPARSISPSSIFNSLPYMRNIVVVAAAQKDLKDRAYRDPVFRTFGKYEGFLVYLTGIKQKEKDTALDFFKKLGMEVVDLTAPLNPPRSLPQASITLDGKTLSVAPPVIKKTKKGMACLTSLQMYPTKGFSTIHSRDDNAPRILKPEFVTLLPINNETSRKAIGRWSEEASKFIVREFGSVGGVALTKIGYDKAIKEGAIHIDEYVYQKVFDYMLTSQTLKDFWAFNPDRLTDMMDWGRSSILDTIFTNEDLRQKFNLGGALSPKDKQYLELWREIKSRSRHTSSDPGIIKVSAYLDAIPIDPIAIDLASKINKGPFMNLLQQDCIRRALAGKHPTDAVNKQKAIDLLVFIINQ